MNNKAKSDLIAYRRRSINPGRCDNPASRLIKRKRFLHQSHENVSRPPQRTRAQAEFALSSDRNLALSQATGAEEELAWQVRGRCMGFPGARRSAATKGFRRLVGAKPYENRSLILRDGREKLDEGCAVLCAKLSAGELCMATSGGMWLREGMNALAPEPQGRLQRLQRRPVRVVAAVCRNLQLDTRNPRVDHLPMHDGNGTTGLRPPMAAVPRTGCHARLSRSCDKLGRSPRLRRLWPIIFRRSRRR